MSEIAIKMPPLGESITEATVGSWFVEPGTKVKKYDPLLEAMSDKVTTEIPASEDGVISQLLVSEGDVVAIGTEILKMEPIVATAETKAMTINKKEVDAVESTTELHLRYSPAVMKIANEKNIDLRDVVGSGKNGRITRKDVINFQPKVVPESPEPEVVTEQVIVEETPKKSSKQAVPVNGLRKMIAQNLLQSVTEIPQAWTMIEVDVTNLVKLRDQVKNQFQAQAGFKLSYFPFFVKAINQALMNHPKLNSSWQDDEIVTHQNINTSIAVATEEALFVPVIKNSNHLSIAGLANEINRLATAVKNNQLESSDMQGGTFTINNTGVFGSVESMGIINAPQAAILQVETIHKEVKVMPDNSIAIRDIVNLCLTIDHRLLDGLAAGRFLNEVKTNLEQIDESTKIY